MIKTKKTNILFLILATLTMVFAGCTKIPDCKELDTTYEKYKLNSDTTQCELYKEIEKNVCGNGVIEDGETYCTCSDDVLKSHPKFGCDGTVGEYLEKTCSDKTNTCEVMQNKKVVDQIKELEFKSSDLTFKADFSIKVPFILNTIDNNKIQVDLEFFNGPTSTSKKVRNVVVKEMKLKNAKSITYGTQTYGQAVNNLGDKLSQKQFDLGDTTEYSLAETLKAELIVSYTLDSYDSKGELTKSENKIDTLSQSLGKWTIINPNFEVEK